MYRKDERMSEIRFTNKEAKQLNNTDFDETEKDVIILIAQIDEQVEFDSNYIRYTFGELLKFNMKKVKVKIDDLAEAIGLSDRQIRRMRGDKVEMIEFRIIIAICVVLQLTIDKAEELLNTKKYSLRCENFYVQVCKQLILKKVSLNMCNLVLKKKGLIPLTDEKQAA